MIRDVRLPQFIMKAIELKKEREQAAEQQRAELERFRRAGVRTPSAPPDIE